MDFKCFCHWNGWSGSLTQSNSIDLVRLQYLCPTGIKFVNISETGMPVSPHPDMASINKALLEKPAFSYVALFHWELPCLREGMKLFFAYFAIYSKAFLHRVWYAQQCIKRPILECITLVSSLFWHFCVWKNNSLRNLYA